MTAQYPWLNAYPENIKWDVTIEAKPLFALLDEAAKTYPKRTAIDFFGKQTSYQELAESVNKLAASLQEMGVKDGTRIGILMPNCPQFVISYYAILKAGGVVVNYNPLYSEGEIQHQIEDSSTEIMITIALQAIYPKVEPALRTTSLKTLIITEFQEALPLTKKLAFQMAKRKEIAEVKYDAQHLDFKPLLATDKPYTSVTLNPQEAIAVLQYTGGTTGTPKGAMLTHANLYCNALQCGMWFAGLRFGEEIILGALPLFHVFAMTTVMNLGIHTGSTLLLHPRFDIKAVLTDIQEKRPTLMPGVPTMFSALNQYKSILQYDITSLKMCFSGGASLPAEVKTQFEDLTKCKLVEGYGLSESSPVLCGNPLFGVNKTGSIGLPLPATQMRIISPDTGEIMPVGEIGEVCASGYQIMKGYLHNDKETQQVIKDGFLHTGDLGYMDAEGYVFIVDRIKEMIISGGYKIFPRMIEEILYANDAILEAAVIGVPHPQRGQEVKLFVVKKEGKDITTSRIREYLSDKVSAYAMPQVIEFRESLPKSPIGKILKRLLA